MASRKITYNIPGLGNLTANLFNHTQELYDFLDYYEHIGRFRRINQLGRLRDVFQGAHHNRYEYVFLQLSLISELCLNKRGELGLSGRRQFCGKFEKQTSDPSLGELLQCLVLLTNMGYLEGTFSTSRAWLTLLKENNSVRVHFRNGLEEEDRPYFDTIIQEYDFYKFQILVALFQLQRYKRKGSDIVQFSTKLLRAYISGDRTDIQIAQLRSLYDTIRQLSFIALDSLYAPVPFNLDLSSVLLNFDSLLESLFIKNTTYRIALRNLETVLQNSVYMSSDSCINTARASEDSLEDISYLISEADGIKSIYYALCPACQTEITYRQVQDIDWIRERKVIQEYRLRLFEENTPYPLLNAVKWEKEVRERIGTSRIRVGLLQNSRRTTVKAAFGITTDNNVQALKAALKCAVEINRLKHEIPKKQRFTQEDNDQQLLMFLLKAVFGWTKRFILENKNRANTAIFVSNGRVDMLKQIDQYLQSTPRFLNADETFEVKKVRDLVKQLNYAGFTMAFVGGIKLFETGNNNESAEFDGMVICPRVNPINPFAYIVEAKNYSNGVTAARNQLNNRVGTYLIEDLEMEIVNLNNRAAFAKIKIKESP